jgi:hypothetical protein
VGNAVHVIRRSDDQRAGALESAWIDRLERSDERPPLQYKRHPCRRQDEFEQEPPSRERRLPDLHPAGEQEAEQKGGHRARRMCLPLGVRITAGHHKAEQQRRRATAECERPMPKL